MHVSVLSQRKVERNKGIIGKRQGGHEWEGIGKFFSSTRAEMKEKEMAKAEEGEGQKLAATVLCHCFRGFCVIVDSLLLFIVCVCLCLG